MNPSDLEALVGRQLRKLPAPPAPLTLLPRVLAAVQAWAQRPWYERAWSTWPVALQAASVALLALVLVAAVMFAPIAEGAAGNLTSELGQRVVARFGGTVAPYMTAIQVMAILWRAVVQPLAVYACVLVALMWLTFAAVGTALNRVVLEGDAKR